MLMTELANQCSNTLTPYQAHDMLITSSYDYEQGTRYSCLILRHRDFFLFSFVGACGTSKGKSKCALLLLSIYTREQLACGEYCSLLHFFQHRYILSDHLCPLYQLPLTSNHLPQQQSTPAATVVHSAPIPPPLRPMSGAGLSRGFSHPGISQVRMPGGGHPGLGRGVGRGMGFGRGAGSRGMGRPSAP